MNQLEQLRQYSTVVADTANFKQLAQFAPRDATTNPSLILKATQDPDYSQLLEQTVAQHGSAEMAEIVDALLVRFGMEILKFVPGRVSTEVDARLSFDTDATVVRARHIVSLYRAAGIDPERILIKIAATWEGMQAARILESEQIHCNLTLLFSFCQAVVCGQAGVQLISPFVGRIYDWYKKAACKAASEYAISEFNDPGVKSVARIYKYYKRLGIKTEVMGASFRNIQQITALAGCDLLTISPSLLKELLASTAPVYRALDDSPTDDSPFTQPVQYTEATFRYALNEDAMATEKLAEGIRGFAADTVKLEKMIDELQKRAGIRRLQ